jgi:ATP/maltotriose-dependent transcriptional regulator MalT
MRRQAGTGSTDPLAEGKEAYRQKRWREARDLLTAAEAAAPLAPADYEVLATADFLLSVDVEGPTVWERAHHVLFERGDIARAARAAFWSGMALLLRGEIARANGWFARAQRMLDDAGLDCVERGYLRIPNAIRAGHQGDPSAAYRIHEEIVAIARRFGDEDLIIFARQGQGRSLLLSGDIESARAVMDEVMVAITTGQVSPIVLGYVYCSVIIGLRQVYDVGRAREWTAALERWCESQPELEMYRGECLVYKAEVLEHTGDWAKALEQMTNARERLSSPPPHPSAGVAAYHEGELHRLSGRFAEAEAAYVKSGELGRSPQPGLALLRLEQGRLESASASVRRALSEAQGHIARAEILPGYVEIMLAAGDSAAAQRGVAELAAIAAATASDYLHAAACQAQGATLLAEGELQRALQNLREAVEIWQGLDATYHAARTRLLIGQACRELHDEESARLEVEVARKALTRLGAVPDLKRIDKLFPQPGPPDHPLSRREVEVAELVAQGLSNKVIAGKLFVSERTVESHVKNVCDKLGFNSRAQVASWVARRTF